ncbi:hypothetical protein ACH5RR_007315 [Cinchona calisaya]|uniref:Uncharacterized protein n=1 Tax=Cinchona calisaya TaxID=153742 RepID=A0ABD3ARX0_9GENT
MVLLIIMSQMVGNYKVENELPPLVEAPPVAVMVEPTRHNSTHQSIETLVVVLAVITILGVVAGIIARLCGGRHFGGSGEHDIEGWVERTCRSCIDAGIPAAPKPEEAKPTTTTTTTTTEEAKPATDEAKK